MEFKDKQSIYLQIADYVCEQIVLGQWPPGERIPSVRDLASTLEVNPNTVMRTYDFLQGKVRQGFQDSLRFVVNSTVGLGGFFDMAAPMGLPQHDEDFGQTLGVWGVNTGSYLFVPLIGPSTYRDAPGIPVSVFSNLLFYAGTFASSAIVGPVTVLSIIDRRARLSGPMRVRDQAALDPYLFVREGFLQQRKHLIYDGDPPPESYEDPMDEDLGQNVPEAAASR